MYASEAASLPEVLEREDALDLVRSVANMETEQQAAKWLENMKQVNSMKQSNMKQEPLSKLLDQEEIKNTVFFLAQLEEEEVSPHTFVKMRK